MDKLVDGIKKINPGDINKSRRIVLDSIGEEAEQKPKPKAQGEKMLDGVFGLRRKPDKEKIKEENKIDPVKIKKAKLNIDQEIANEEEGKGLNNESISEEKKKSPPPKIELDKKAEKKRVKKRKNNESNKLKTEQEKKEKERIKEEEKKKKEEEKLTLQKKRENEKAKRLKEKEELKKKKKQDEEKQKKKKEEEAILKKEKAKAKWKNFKNNSKQFYINLKNKCIHSLKLVIIVLLIIVLVYMILAFVLLNYSNQSKFLRAITNRLTIPAIISSDGIMNLKEYQKIQEQYTASNSTEKFHTYLAKQIILNKLFLKYSTSDIDSLKEQIIYDEEINFAPYNRISKIKKLITEEGNFIKTASKLGDVGQATVYRNKLDDYEFANDVIDLKKNETSDIIVTKSGYYIAHCFDKNSESTSISYVYIPNISLEKYLYDESMMYNYWSLVNF